MASSSIDDRFADIARTFLHNTNVSFGSEKKGFGSSALKVDDKIFAMITGGRLVIKLPRQRVAELVTQGDGVPLETGGGRPMKEWFSLDPASTHDWSALIQEALSFVGK